MKNKNIYIVLVKAHTGLGKFARFFSKYEYTHIAVCLDDELNDFITFSRKKHYSPFESGFMHEYIDYYAFGKNESVKLKIFKIPVNNEIYINIKSYINQIENDKDYIFNIYSMATMSIFHGFKIYKAHNCMSFVSKIIELSNTVNMEKKYYKYNIKELDLLLKEYKYEEKEFIKENNINKEYMKKVGIFKNIKLFVSLNCKLLYRLVVKRNDYYE